MLTIDDKIYDGFRFMMLMVIYDYFSFFNGKSSFSKGANGNEEYCKDLTKFKPILCHYILKIVL